MGFRVRIIDAAPRPTAADSAPVQVADEAEIVDRYLLALDSARITSARAEFDELERAFVRHAASFSARRGISYAAWRDVGVAAATLVAAGVREASTSVVSPAYAQHRRVAALVQTHQHHAKRRSRFRDSRQTSWRSSRRQLPRS